MLPLVTKRRFPLDQGSLLAPAEPHAFAIKLLLLFVHILEDLVHPILIVAFIPDATWTLADAQAHRAGVLPVLLPNISAVYFVCGAAIHVANVEVGLRSQLRFIVV